MKKIYVKPELEAVEVKIHTNILAGSMSRNEEDAPINGDEYESLSRGYEW